MQDERRTCLGKIVGHKPCDSLALDVCLVIEALDRDKHLTQGMRPHYIRLELH